MEVTISDFQLWFPLSFLLMATFTILINYWCNKKWLIIEEDWLYFFNGASIACLIFILVTYLKFVSIWNDLLSIKEFLNNVE